MVEKEGIRNIPKMPSRVGVNLRASAYLHQGDRKYMEDEFVVAYQRTADKKDIEYAFFGIFDGHGGKEAAHFAKDHLMDNIVSQRTFWSDDDADVLDAIREGFIQTHMAMWKVLEKWPPTASGWPSTSGSTASVAFIRKQKIYIGHVGDSGICLGYEDSSDGEWSGEHLTKDHKPESNQEKSRITRCGGKVVNKSGVPRVVWNRPKRGHKGPVRRSTPMDEIPFLAVARSLGDLWSYNPTNNQFVVSPVPDVHVHPIDIRKHRCLIFGTDGLWNVMSPYMAVNIAYHTELNNENHYLGLVMPCGSQHMWVNPSRSVVKGALDRYSRCNLRADNTSAVVVFLDPPGRPKREVLLQRNGVASTPAVPREVPPPETPNKSADCKVQVHVYNLDNNKAPKTSADKTPHGLLTITERLPQTWQVDGKSGESDKPKENQPASPAIPRHLGGNVTDAQASTPGTSEIGLKRNPSTAALCASPAIPSRIAALSSPVSSSVSRLSTASSSASPCNKVSTLSSSLRSGGRGATDATASPASHNTRLSLCTSCGTSPRKGGKQFTSSSVSSNLPDKYAAAHHTRSAAESPNSADTSSVVVSNRAAKREREDESAESSHKKLCTECKCDTDIQSSLQSQDSRSDKTSSDTSTSSSTSASDSSISGGVAHPLASSPKSLKMKSSSSGNIAEPSNKMTRKRDDIQIPVISSSTSVQCKTTNTDSSSSDPAKIKMKKITRNVAGDVVQVELVKHRTRSSVAAKPGESRAGGSSEAMRLTKPTPPPPSSESPASSRVLKSVNRGSPNESSKSTGKNQSNPLKRGSSVTKTSKYGFEVSKKKRCHSAPSIGSDSSTAPPPKKKSATMHLRSGKPMITRSQEKGCRSWTK